MLYGNLPEWAKDQIRNTTDVHFSFTDRVKILFGFKVTMYLKIDTEFLPGEMKTESEVIVWRPSRRKVCRQMEAARGE